MIKLNKKQGGMGIILCLPQTLKIDTATIAKFQCQLKVIQEAIIVHVNPAKEFLHFRKGPVVDDNGEIITSLDPDIDKKFVVDDRDINLYFALKNEGMLDDENVFVEVIPLFQGRCR